MSRIGRLHITLPAGVSVEFKDQIVTVKGPKGELSRKIDSKTSLSTSTATKFTSFARPRTSKPSPCTVFTASLSTIWFRAS